MSLSFSYSLPHAKKRYFLHRFFYMLTFTCVCLCLFFLTFLLGRMIQQGATAFYNYYVVLDIPLTLHKTDLEHPDNPEPEELQKASYTPLLQEALLTLFPNAQTSGIKREIFKFVSADSAFDIRDVLVQSPELAETKQRFAFNLSSDVEMYIKHQREKMIYDDVHTPLTTEFSHPDFKYRAGEAVFKTQGMLARYLSHMGCKNLELPTKPEDSAKICLLTDKSESFFLMAGHMFAKIKKVEFLADKKETIYVHLLTSFDRDLVKEMKNWSIARYPVPESKRRLSDLSLAAVEQFLNDGIIRSSFPNMAFFTKADSRNPEQAGVAGAFTGSLMTIFVCLLCALPIGICAAVYLEEFAVKNAITEFFEVNINNLASVPSIIYGLLGLSLLLNTFHLPRSAPLAGGIVLGIMSLPVMIIATRAALQTVPQSLRDAALALGATPIQTFFHHTFPAALPGIMTGAVLALSRAIGETAPLLLIGMVAFISDIPKGLTEAATVLPVQIFLWTENPELGYIERTAAAILVLLAVMITLNGMAVYVRNKFEKRY